MRNYFKNFLEYLFGSINVLNYVLFENGVINPKVYVSSPVDFLLDEWLICYGSFIDFSYFVDVDGVGLLLEVGVVKPQIILIFIDWKLIFEGFATLAEHDGFHVFSTSVLLLEVDIEILNSSLFVGWEFLYGIIEQNTGSVEFLTLCFKLRKFD